MKNKLHEIITAKQRGQAIGVPSFCTANYFAIKAILTYAKINNVEVVIEATANQVNQYGGYTNMKPADFVKFVTDIAKEIDCPSELIILGGDHLGPLTWTNLNEEEAMLKARELVRQFVEAGFTKIHLDTSMKLKSDPINEPLDTRVVAERGASLMQVCQETYDSRKLLNPNSVRPVFIIGSEVPIPGGAQEEESISVTDPEDLIKTYNTYCEVFKEHGLEESLSDVIAIVTQPGVEFSDHGVVEYDRELAKPLMSTAKKMQNIVLEGHSTDYQPKMALKQMVEDGVGILKVGPALTFAIRAGLFALSAVEQELICPAKCSNFKQVLIDLMDSKPDNWKKYYFGDSKDIEIKKKYSYSDRVRYYLSDASVTEAINKLFNNLDNTIIPLGLLHQYMPEQYYKVKNHELELKSEALVMDFVNPFIEEYFFAAGV
ncbi:MAG: class II D-tagatose-bisphosphate aldolase, non-catalytic subunit [Clostridiaceae bacterium]|nr:class II D-tagatose-bisphosphate aldolase, non-catalytic subunit [Clostridiaceae bacterium]